MRSVLSLDTPVDLSTCAQEPIRIPGTIQPHGILFVLDDSLRVLQASENATRTFPAGVLGKKLIDLFGAEWAASFAAFVNGGSIERNPLYVGALTLNWESERRAFHAVAHRVENVLILELEQAQTAQPVTFTELYPLVRTFMAELQRTSRLEDLADLATREVRRITGFDRVLLYQFKDNWNGHVISESCDSALDSYLNFWFPASDIPEQARELYRINRLRLIADVDYQPVAILPLLDPRSGKPVDLSFSVLRSVSPIHIEYLKNMGVGASMSISLLRNGELWGLIACHHRSALVVPYEIRTACDFLGQAFSLQLSAAEQAANYEQRLRLKLIQSQLLTFMAQEEHFVDGLAKHPEEVLGLVGAQGAAILFDDKCTLIGSTPTEETVKEISDWLAAHQHNELYVSDTFSSDFGDEKFLNKACGVLAISISKLYRSFVIWFRPEVVQTITWSGNPSKSVEQEIDGGMRIHPRKSFEAWKQVVRAKSAAWQPAEIEIAGDLRVSILEIVLKKAEELAHLSGELERSNKELEAFSYSVSHDLRAPFRHIVGYSTLLRERVANVPDQDVVRYIDTIIDSAQSAGSLVDNLLHFAQIGRSAVNSDFIPQAELVAEVQQEIERDIPQGRQINWQIAPLPVVRGDLVLLRLVWQNLLSNAVKYTRNRADTIIQVGSEQTDKETIFFVRDNGVGFDSRYAHKLFGVFQRLHRMEDFEGNGIGLANVRRVISRHGGRTWAEGELGHGATFYFSVPCRPEDWTKH